VDLAVVVEDKREGDVGGGVMRRWIRIVVLVGSGLMMTIFLVLVDPHTPRGIVVSFVDETGRIVGYGAGVIPIWPFYILGIIVIVSILAILGWLISLLPHRE
jgi:hypothetical protein